MSGRRRSAYNLVSASGPQVLINGLRQPPIRARLATTKLAGRGALECLCSDLRLWATAMRRADQRVQVVTNLPAISAGSSTVDIVLPGLATLADVGLTTAPDSTFRSAGRQPVRPSYWAVRPGEAAPRLGQRRVADAAAPAGPAEGLPGDRGRHRPLARGHHAVNSPTSGTT